MNNNSHNNSNLNHNTISSNRECNHSPGIKLNNKVAGKEACLILAKTTLPKTRAFKSPGLKWSPQVFINQLHLSKVNWDMIIIIHLLKKHNLHRLETTMNHNKPTQQEEQQLLIPPSVLHQIDNLLALLMGIQHLHSAEISILSPKDVESCINKNPKGNSFPC